MNPNKLTDPEYSSYLIEDGSEVAYDRFYGDGTAINEHPAPMPEPIGNPIHWWPVEKNDGSVVHDHVGSENLTVHGASLVSDLNEVGGRRLFFDSSNEERVHGNASTSSDKITIICTAQGTQDTDRGGLVSMAAPGSVNRRLGLRLDHGSDDYFFVRSGSVGINRRMWQPEYQTLNRNRYAAIWDSETTSTKTYINGSQFGPTLSEPSGSFDWSDPWISFGSMVSHWGNHTRFFDGFLSDVVVYDHILDENEIYDDYQRSLI